MEKVKCEGVGDNDGFFEVEGGLGLKRIDPKRNAVILELTDNGLICHIECKDADKLPLLSELAERLDRTARGY